jgi:hypothetical protein
MNEIIQEIMEQAIRNLGLCGCAYVVKKPDGTIVGDFAGITSTKSIAENRMIERTDYKSTGYVDKLKEMKAGDTIVIDCGYYNPFKFRNALCASCFYLFGKSSVATRVFGNTIEVTRIK